MKIRPDPKAQTKAKLRRKKISKRTPFGRVFFRSYDDVIDKIEYLHTTKGVRRQAATYHLFQALGA